MRVRVRVKVRVRVRVRVKVRVKGEGKGEGEGLDQADRTTQKDLLASNLFVVNTAAVSRSFGKGFRSTTELRRKYLGVWRCLGFSRSRRWLCPFVG